MKKVIVVSFILFSIISFGQKYKKGVVEYGVNLGYNMSSIGNNANDISEEGSGFNVGLAADYFFSDRWSIKGKLIYDQKGWDNGFIDISSFDPVNPVTRYRTDFNLNYLTVPVMANWHFGKKRNFYLNFGPYVGFLLSADETTFNTNLQEFFNSTDFGISMGIGVKIPLSDKLKISFELEEQDGFSYVFKNDLGSKGKNGRGSINVGVNFLL